MADTCLVSGSLADLGADPVPNIDVTFTRSDVSGQGGVVVFPQAEVMTSDEDGALSGELLPGPYEGKLVVDGRPVRFKVTVPEAPTGDLADMIPGPDGPISPQVLAEAIAARDEAETLAEDAGASASDAAGSATAAAGSATSALAARDATYLARDEAEDAEAAAAVSADEAGESEEAAAASATGAAGSAVAAAAARDLAIGAIAADRLFLSTAAALAAPVPVGQAFVTPGSGASSVLVYRVDAGPVATLVAEVPTAAALVSKADAAYLYDYTSRASGQGVLTFAALRSGKKVKLGDVAADGETFRLPKVQSAHLDLMDAGTARDRVISYQSRSVYGGIPVIDTAGRIIRLAGASTGTTSPTYVPPDDITTFSPTIDLTGTVDQSGALVAAHDAAAAAGLKALYIEGPILAPTALKLGAVLFRSRSGKGRLIGTPRKHVVPVGAPSPRVESDVIPAIHLTRLAAKLATATPSDPAIVVIMGDSWSNQNQRIGPGQWLEELLRLELYRQLGAAKMANLRVVNRGVGGQDWTQGATIPSDISAVTDWYLNPAANWLTYVTSIEQSDLSPTARKPDLVLLMFGMNEATIPSPTVWQSMDTVLTTIRAVSPTPDIIMATSPVPSVMDAARYTEAAMAARAGNAALVRSMALKRGLGLLDLGRVVDQAHFGFDPRRVAFQVVSSGSATTPLTFPEPVTDFVVELTFGSDMAADFATAGTILVPLSGTAGNVLTLERDGGTNKLAITVAAATGKADLARTVLTGGLPVAGSGQALSVEAKGPWLTIMHRNAVVWRGPVERGAERFTPSITVSGSALTLTAKLSAGRPTLTSPFLTDADLWGGEVSGVGDIGGNNINHMSEWGRSEVFGRALAATRFA